MKIVNKSVTEVINTEYLEYAMYVLENRAIPSAIDGFKMVHRKLVYAMLNLHKGNKVKCADLAGISNCVSPETILWKNGEKVTISELYDTYLDGDKVLAHDELTGRSVDADILGVFKRPAVTGFINITMESGEKISVTPEHQFLLTTGIWTMAKDLLDSDDIMNY